MWFVIEFTDAFAAMADAFKCKESHPRRAMSLFLKAGKGNSIFLKYQNKVKQGILIASDSVITGFLVFFQWSLFIFFSDYFLMSFLH